MTEFGSYKDIGVDLADQVATVEIRRPPHNFFDIALIRELAGAFEALDDEPACRAIVLAAQGKAFCAGADLEWLASTVHHTESQHAEDARALQSMLAALDTAPVPLVGRIHGAAIAGGLGLVSVCDVAIAPSDAIFATTEVRIGIVPALISPFVLRKVSASAARWAFLTGARFSAQRAFEIGLVHEVVAPADLDAAVARTVEALVAAGPEAAAAAKSLIQTVAGRAPEEVAPLTARINVERRMSSEGQAGVHAFLRKQPPPWARS